jgi:hypothetical protein
MDFSGDGSITCDVDRLDLAAGSYTLDMTAHLADGTISDRDHRCAFTVVSDVRSGGIVAPPHRWRLEGGFQA